MEQLKNYSNGYTAGFLLCLFSGVSPEFVELRYNWALTPAAIDWHVGFSLSLP